MKQNKRVSKSILVFILGIFSLKIVSAHCPLCTAGAGAAAAGAVWLGIKEIVVALFLGAFSVSMGMWFARVIEKRKKFFKGQSKVITLIASLLTFIPLIPLISHMGPLYINLIGKYGTLFNQTYVFDYSIGTGILGGLIVAISPEINKKIKILRKGKGIPCQGILITFTLLILVALVLQFTI